MEHVRVVSRRSLFIGTLTAYDPASVEAKWTIKIQLDVREGDTHVAMKDIAYTDNVISLLAGRRGTGPTLAQYEEARDENQILRHDVVLQ